MDGWQWLAVMLGAFIFAVCASVLLQWTSGRSAAFNVGLATVSSAGPAVDVSPRLANQRKQSERGRGDVWFELILGARRTRHMDQ